MKIKVNFGYQEKSGEVSIKFYWSLQVFHLLLH